MSRTNPTTTPAEPTTAAPPKAGKRRRLRRVITGIVLAAAAAAIPLTTGVTAASAAVQGDSEIVDYPLYNVYISSLSSGMLLDVQYGSLSPGAHVIQWPLDYGANQLWDFQPDYASSTDYNWGYIINANSGQCVSIDGVLGDPVFQSPCQGADWQRWLIIGRSGGPYYIESYYMVSRYNENTNLDVYQGSDSPGAVIDLWPNTVDGITPTDANQLFNLLPGPPA